MITLGENLLLTESGLHITPISDIYRTYTLAGQTNKPFEILRLSVPISCTSDSRIPSQVQHS